MTNTREQFDAVKYAVCIQAMPGKLTCSEEYAILDTSLSTIDVRADDGTFDSFPSSHFLPKL